MKSTLKTRLKIIVEGRDTPAGRRFDWFVQGLIFLSLAIFSLDTLPDLGTATRAWLGGMEIAIILIFTAEYAARLYVADKKFRYARSFYGCIDLLVILPFYLAFLYPPIGMNTGGLRVFRCFQLLWLLKIVRYSAALNRIRRALSIAKEEIILFFFASVIFIYLSSVGIYFFEKDAQPDTFRSIFHSLWWAVATLTTVGYGDIYPITAGGRVFTFLILMFGIGLFAVPSGLLASALGKVRMEEHAAAVGEKIDRERPLGGE